MGFTMVRLFKPAFTFGMFVVDVVVLGCWSQRKEVQLWESVECIFGLITPSLIKKLTE